MFLHRFTEYLGAIASRKYFSGISIHERLYAIHKDIVTIWNIRGLNEVCTRMYIKSSSSFTLDSISLAMPSVSEWRSSWVISVFKTQTTLIIQGGYNGNIDNGAADVDCKSK